MLLKHVSVAAGAIVLSLTPALSLTYRQTQGYQNYLPTPNGQLDGQNSWSTNTLCVKDCDNDINPCDPGYFKRADGRCNMSR